jgi:hypothetical protein
MHQVDCDGGREFQLQAFVLSLCSISRAEGDTVTPVSAVLVSDHRARLCLSSYTDRASNASHRPRWQVVTRSRVAIALFPIGLPGSRYRR